MFHGCSMDRRNWLSTTVLPVQPQKMVVGLAEFSSLPLLISQKRVCAFGSTMFPFFSPVSPRWSHWPAREFIFQELRWYFRNQGHLPCLGKAPSWAAEQVVPLELLGMAAWFPVLLNLIISLPSVFECHQGDPWALTAAWNLHLPPKKVIFLSPQKTMFFFAILSSSRISKPCDLHIGIFEIKIHVFIMPLSL